MVGPPSYVQGVTLFNKTNHKLRASVHFGTNEQEANGYSKITEVVIIPATESKVIEGKSYDKGSYSETAPLDSIIAEVVETNDTSNVSTTEQKNLTYRPQVDQVVEMLNVDLTFNTQASSLEAKPSV